MPKNMPKNMQNAPQKNHKKFSAPITGKKKSSQQKSRPNLFKMTPTNPTKI